MNTLMLLLPVEPPDGRSLACWSLDAAGAVDKHLLSLAELAQGRYAEFLAVVPAQQLSWHMATLPAGVKTRGDARLLPVLQGMLEEALLDDSECVHVALAPGAEAGAQALLAVCDKAWLGGWLQALEQAGIQVGRTLPEVPPDCLADAAVCTGHAHGSWITVLDGGIPLTVPLAADAHWLVAVPAQASAATYQDAVQCLGADRVQLQDEAAWLAGLRQTRWDLAQHGFALNRRDRWRRKAVAQVQTWLHAPAWRGPRRACLALAAVLVVGLHLQWWWSARSLQAKQVAITQTVRASFPQLQLVVDAPVQMQREVQRLREAAGVLSAQDLQPLMAAAGRALQPLGARPGALDYTGSELLLHGLSADAVAGMNAQLAHTAYRANAHGAVVRLGVAP